MRRTVYIVYQSICGVWAEPKLQNDQTNKQTDK